MRPPGLRIDWQKGGGVVLKKGIELFVLFVLGGAAYILVEILWRQESHESMFVLGGLLFVLLGALNEGRFSGLSFPRQAVMGSAVITAFELAAGLLLNVRMGLEVWDYADLPLNFMGQISLRYFLLWIPLSGVAIGRCCLVRRGSRRRRR